MWKVGDRVFHDFNPDLGPGRVIESDRRRLVVEFLISAQVLEFSANTDALKALHLERGAAALVENELIVIAEIIDSETCLLEDGRRILSDRVWPIPHIESASDLLSRGRVASVADFENRLDALKLEHLREARGFGSFLGGRIRLYPHQLYAAEKSCSREPVRWLLADGVGLGKTVEACLVMNRLIHTGSAERTLVVAPESLTVQWLGELWRKHHQVFTLLDEQRIKAVASEQGIEFNPFDAHHQAIIAIEKLVNEPRLVEMAVEAGIDLLVVDEAHHLQRKKGHPGNSRYRAIAPITSIGRNVLLLSATPLEDDALGFLRLVQLLRPDQLPEDADLEENLAQRMPLPACTTATRAADIGGWPARIGFPIALDESAWQPFYLLEQALRKIPSRNEITRRHKADLISRALSSPMAVADRLNEDQRQYVPISPEMNDPRLQYLVENAPIWRMNGEKTLVFVAYRESLDVIKEALEKHAHLRVAIFHEDLSVKRRDIEVAQLRLPEGPSILVSTECGGEGRNFEMCRRLVLYDLPWSPRIVEQRIGRLDRIGRTVATEVVYFKPPTGFSSLVVSLYEKLGLFEHSLGGIDRELVHLGREIEVFATDGPEIKSSENASSKIRSSKTESHHFDEVLERALAARTRVEEAAFRELHRQPYHQDMAEAILARIPPELENLINKVVLNAAARFGFDVEEQSGPDTHLITLGTEALVDRLPGVPPESRFLGTFSREYAVERETLDFFSSGHPLVEGILTEIHEGRHGRTACFSIKGSEEIFGLLAIYSDDQGVSAVAVDSSGRSRPELAAQLIDPDTRREYADYQLWTAMPEWRGAIQRLAGFLEETREPRAVAAFQVKK